MHYILNTSFQAPGGVSLRPKIGGPTRFGQQPEAAPLTNSKFESGEIYTIVHIKKVENGVEYTFKSGKGKVVTEIFQSCNDADKLIANMRGETLPDYNSFYSNSSRG
tara:strand:+ start:939 stop:1259 length:321 start_codon:yes stop_codon:yes gene_type:complete